MSDDRLTNWNFAIPGAGLTFLDTVARADAAVVTFVEASSTQAVERGATRTLDSAFTPEEIASLKSRMGEVRLLTYRVEGAATRESIERGLRFARDMGAETVVVPRGLRWTAWTRWPIRRGSTWPSWRTAPGQLRC